MTSRRQELLEEVDYGKVNALLMSGGGLRSYGFDMAGFTRRNDIGHVLFLPYAIVEGGPDGDQEEGVTHENHTNLWRPYVERDLGLQSFDMVAEDSEEGWAKALLEYSGILATGGNTFMVAHELERRGLLNKISERVLEGKLAYMGISAGSGVACATIQGTNDDPIVEPPMGYGGLGIVPFNIKPHYFEPKEGQGEPQQVRIERYLAANERPHTVVGLPERTSLLVEEGKITYLASGAEGNAWVFERGKEHRSFEPASDLSFLLDPDSE